MQRPIKRAAPVKERNDLISPETKTSSEAVSGHADRISAKTVDCRLARRPACGLLRGGSAPATVSISGTGGTTGTNPGGTTVASTPSTPTPSAGFTALVLKARPAQFSGNQRCPPFLDYGTPSLGTDFLCRTGFAIGHDPRSRTPLWVIERIGLGSLNGGVARTDNFRADPDLLPGRRAELEDYSGSGYDRGHMAPAGNLTWSNQAMVESFYLSNIAPQNPALNRGAWARLEENIRNWVLERNDLVIITGPVFGMQDDVIGRSQCVFHRLFQSGIRSGTSGSRGVRVSQCRSSDQ